MPSPALEHPVPTNEDLGLPSAQVSSLTEPGTDWSLWILAWSPTGSGVRLQEHENFLSPEQIEQTFLKQPRLSDSGSSGAAVAQEAGPGCPPAITPAAERLSACCPPHGEQRPL